MRTTKSTSLKQNVNLGVGTASASVDSGDDAFNLRSFNLIYFWDVRCAFRSFQPLRVEVISESLHVLFKVRFRFDQPSSMAYSKIIG